MTAAIVAGVVVLIAAALVLLDTVFEHLRQIDRRHYDAERHHALMRELRRHSEGPT